MVIRCNGPCGSLFNFLSFCLTQYLLIIQMNKFIKELCLLIYRRIKNNYGDRFKMIRHFKTFSL